MRKPSFAVTSIVLLSLGFSVGLIVGSRSVVNAQASDRVFELRTYTLAEGNARTLAGVFGSHISKLFTKHQMTNVGYWIPQDDPAAKNTLIYILSHPDRQKAKEHWDAFRKDPGYKEFRDEEARVGVKVEKVESVFMVPTDFSAIK